jgi:hypothetical protein
VIGVCTLLFVKSQTAATRESAGFMRATVETMIKAERAWVMVDIDWQPGPHLSEGDGSDGRNTSIFVNCVCRNLGKSFAQLVEKSYVFQIMHTLPREPDFNNTNVFHHASEYVAPDSATEPYRLSPLCNGHRKSGHMMVLYGRVKYRDVYGEHETRFGYQITTMGNLERVPVGSYPKYNEHT